MYTFLVVKEILDGGEGPFEERGVVEVRWLLTDLTEDLAGINLFSGYDRILVPSEEAYAANTLAVNEHLLIPAG